MKIGPKFKKARKLGAPVFDKTQTQKFQLNQERKAGGRRGRAPSEYGLQLKEKQKARYCYLVPERQFARYVREAMEHVSGQPAQKLFERLEMRLDNVVYRLGLAQTKSAARQMVNHGHITVNDRKVDVPSHYTSVGDVVAVREASKSKGMFDGLAEQTENYTPPAWLQFDIKNLKGSIEGVPQLKDATDLLFDMKSILEFYSR